jgi:glycosyltransferase involved in cell wall biosynthesis
MMKKPPRISVIVPVFQAEASIGHCLRSITGQSLEDMEILVVHRPGKDRTWQEIQAVGDSRIRILEQHEDSGPGGARNLGIAVARGEYLGFVEADDSIDADFYATLYAHCQSKGADMACASLSLHGKPLRASHGGPRTLQSFADKLDFFQNGACFDKLFRTKLVKQHNISFAEGLRWEDNPFLIKAAFHSGKAVTCPETCYHYRPSPWSADYRQELEGDVAPILAEIARFMEQNALAPAERAALFRFLLRSFAGGFLYNNGVYRALTEYFGFSFPLFLRRQKRRFKEWRRSFGGLSHG